MAFDARIKNALLGRDIAFVGARVIFQAFG